jgi:hypothetical protein
MGDQPERSEESWASTQHEHSAILSSIREPYKHIGFRTHQDVAERVHKIDEATAAKEPISKEQALSYLRQKAVSENDRSKFFRAALKLIAEHIGDIEAYYRPRNVESLRQIRAIISKYNIPINRNEFPTSDEGIRGNDVFIDTIIDRWKKPYASGPKHLRNGIYQMLRRCKPDASDEGVPDDIVEYWSDPLNHAVICELIYVYSSSMQCIRVTTEGNIHIGSIFINHEHTMYVLFQ